MCCTEKDTAGANAVFAVFAHAKQKQMYCPRNPTLRWNLWWTLGIWLASLLSQAQRMQMVRSARWMTLAVRGAYSFCQASAGLVQDRLCILVGREIAKYVDWLVSTRRLSVIAVGCVFFPKRKKNISMTTCHDCTRWEQCAGTFCPFHG